MTYCVAPIFPLIIPISFVWFAGMYCLERLNITRIYRKSDYHSSKLMQWMMVFLRRSVMLFLLGVTGVFGFASAKFNTRWSMAATVGLPLLYLIVFFV
jgi:uncharacterized membrane protein